MHVKRLRMTRHSGESDEDEQKKGEEEELSIRPKRNVYKPIEY